MAKKLGRDLTLHTVRRLGSLTLKIVHALVSQVAHVLSDADESQGLSRSMGVTPMLQKMPSGPDTFSHSLFDMLHAEVFVAFRSVVPTANGGPDSGMSQSKFSVRGEASESASNFKGMSFGASLDGEEYIYHLLCLLHSVAHSEVCVRYLASPKWVTTLLNAIGLGGLSVQRRLMQLLCRLFTATHLESAVTGVGSLAVDDVSRAYIGATIGDRYGYFLGEPPSCSEDVGYYRLAQMDSRPECDKENVSYTVSLFVRILVDGAAADHPLDLSATGDVNGNDDDEGGEAVDVVPKSTAPSSPQYEFKLQHYRRGSFLCPKSNPNPNSNPNPISNPNPNPTPNPVPNPNPNPNRNPNPNPNPFPQVP